MNHYPDRGCATGGPSCLECPLPRCVHDGPPMFVQSNRASDARIAAAVKALHLPMQTAVAVIAEDNNLTHRAVYRILQRHDNQRS